MGQMEENIRRFINSQDKAKRLIQMDARGELNKYKDKAREAYELSEQNNYEMTENVPYATRESNIQQNTSFSKSKLPKEILESFKNNPIDASGMNVTTSILDKLNIVPSKKVIKEEKIEESKPIISENTNSNIDYSMIKLIVEDCIKKYTSALKKTILNESKINENVGTLQAMKIGNKFSFIDNSGNIYEATLKKVGNINKK